MKVAFVTDTGTGKSIDYFKAKGIVCLPLQLEVDGISYDETVTIHHDDVIRALHEEKLVKTSLPKVGLIQEAFEALKKQGYDTIFAVPICNGLSSTLQTMAMVANQLDLAFVGVDCYVTAVVEQVMIELAKELYEKGESLEAIQIKLEEIATSCHTVLLCDDLQHMKRGGRLTPMAAALGGLLKIKPVLYLGKETRGRVDVYDKVRTMSKAKLKVIGLLKSKGVDESYSFTVAHVDCLEAAQKYADEIKSHFGNITIQVIDLVSAVGAHTGLGCLALQVFKV